MTQHHAKDLPLIFAEGLLLHLSILFYLLGQINPSKLVIMCHLNKILPFDSAFTASSIF